MPPEERAKKLIETLGYKKALSLAKKTMNLANNDFDWHKWNAVIYKIKKLK